MPDVKVVMIDTSVLLRIVGIDGEAELKEVLSEFEARRALGERFIIPVTAIVETGNRIATSSGDRRKHASQLVKIIEAARSNTPPWIIRAVDWNEEFLDALVAGDSTGSTLEDLIGSGRMGTGDVAVLVERDQFRAQTAYAAVEVWSLDAELRAHGSAS